MFFILSVLTYGVSTRFTDALWEALGYFAFAIAAVLVLNLGMTYLRHRTRGTVTGVRAGKPVSRLVQALMPGEVYRAAVRRQRALENSDARQPRINVLDTMPPSLGDHLARHLRLNPFYGDVPGVPVVEQHRGVFGADTLPGRVEGRVRGLLGWVK